MSHPSKQELKGVLELQEQRSQQFSRFDKMVKAYCDSLDKGAFDASFSEICKCFSIISESIRKIEKSLLESEENKEACLLIRQLQEQEKEHFQQKIICINAEAKLGELKYEMKRKTMITKELDKDEADEIIRIQEKKYQTLKHALNEVKGKISDTIEEMRYFVYEES